MREGHRCQTLGVLLYLMLIAIAQVDLSQVSQSSVWLSLFPSCSIIR